MGFFCQSGGFLVFFILCFLFIFHGSAVWFMGGIAWLM